MCGPMVANTRVSGPRTTCMARASTLGRMVVAMRVTTSMIGSMVLEFTRGRTVDSMRATGTTASNTERVFIDNQTVLSAVESGKREKEWHGWMNFENSKLLPSLHFFN